MQHCFLYAPPSTCSNEDIGSTEEALKFKTQIEEFMMKGGETVLSFPASLTSYHRRIIHEVATVKSPVHC